MRCPECSSIAWKNGFNVRRQQIFKCKMCKKQFTEVSKTPYSRARFPKEVITYAMKLNVRYGLSCYMISRLLETKGVKVSHVTVYKWIKKYQGK